MYQFKKKVGTAMIILQSNAQGSFGRLEEISLRSAKNLRAKILFAEGVSAAEHGNISRAIKKLSNALDLSSVPQVKANAYYLLMVLLFTQRQYPEMNSLYVRWKATLNPSPSQKEEILEKVAQANYDLETRAMITSDIDSANAALALIDEATEACLQINPNNPTCLALKGEIYYQYGFLSADEGNGEDALSFFSIAHDSFDQAFVLNPRLNNDPVFSEHAKLTEEALDK